jgi:hypothetical protein
VELVSFWAAAVDPIALISSAVTPFYTINLHGSMKGTPTDDMSPVIETLNHLVCTIVVQVQSDLRANLVFRASMSALGKS